MLSQEDTEIILSRIKEPFIQKYLKSLAVHVCTLPVTQVVSIIVALGYVWMHPELPRTQAWAIGLGIIALFQVVPLSPGSLVRGLYVLYLVIRERNFRDYNIAVFLGFFKYIGYLAFPIQMAYRYPVLARFMAGHWASESVHIVPVFGESGALLEHWVYRLFYNWPLTLRRRISKRFEMRKTMRIRRWHTVPYGAAVLCIFGLADFFFLEHQGEMPKLIQDQWWIGVVVPLMCGSLITRGYGGAAIGKRITGAAVCGALTAALSSVVSFIIGRDAGFTGGLLVSECLWRMFIFTIFATVGAVLTELMLPDPDMKTKGSACRHPMSRQP